MDFNRNQMYSIFNYNIIYKLANYVKFIKNVANFKYYSIISIWK